MSATEEKLTTLLQAADAGDATAASSLLPLIYRELRQLAARRLADEPAGQTLQATALVHEVYLRLARGQDHWQGRGHFFAAAARAMRCILIDRARARGAQKRGGGWQRSPADDEPSAEERSREELLALDSALTKLEQRDPRKAQVVQLRYFAGLSIEEVADTLGISASTVKNEWMFARAWLQSELADVQ